MSASVDESPQELTFGVSISYWHNIVQDATVQERGRRVMAPKGTSGGARGFASMDDERKKRIASQGGLASAKAKNTSNRGFASMDKNKQREISSMGGKASRSTQSPRHEGNEENAGRRDTISEKDASERDLNSLEGHELESSGKTQASLAYSETDEDEDEGLGDGNLGRSTRGGVESK